MNETYKQHAENRLLGQSGTSLWDVTAVCSYIFYSTSIRRYAPPVPEWMWYSGLGMAAVQLPVWGNMTLLLFGVGSIAWNQRGVSAPALKKPAGGEHVQSFTPFRALLMLLTIYCILAVDFELFPNRHMKTEWAGHSLMDIGVGAFVVSHGFCMSFKITRSPFSAIKKWLRTSFPLACCGVLRIFLVKIANYHEHVSEYGVHWNFFFTLSLMPLLILPLVPVLRSRTATIILTVIILSVHQYSCIVNSEFLKSDVRETLFEKNKEGITSLPGYLVMFCGGILLGNVLRSSSSLYLGAVTVFCLITSVVLNESVQPCSRRLCNGAYVTMVMFVTTLILFLHTTFPCGESEFLNSISRYSLLIFLSSNLLTGCINMSVQTLSCSTFTSLIILALYMFVSTNVVVKVLKKVGV